MSPAETVCLLLVVEVVHRWTDPHKSPVMPNVLLVEEDIVNQREQ